MELMQANKGRDFVTIRDDALEFLGASKIFYNTVDCIVCDPPYKLTSGGPSGMLGGILDPANYSNSGEIVPCDIDWPDFMPLLYAVLKDQGHAYIMCNNRNVQAMLNAAEAAGFGFHNLLIWDKVSATANRWYMKNCEFTGFFYKGKAKMINRPSSKMLTRMPHVDETNHPTEKPVLLMQHYITNSTKAGDLVLDPFMGTGATGVAAIKSGRKFLGIEKDKGFYEQARDRLISLEQSEQESNTFFDANQRGDSGDASQPHQE